MPTRQGVGYPAKTQKPYRKAGEASYLVCNTITIPTNPNKRTRKETISRSNSIKKLGPNAPGVSLAGRVDGIKTNLSIPFEYNLAPSLHFSKLNSLEQCCGLSLEGSCLLNQPCLNFERHSTVIMGHHGNNSLRVRNGCI